MKAVTPIINNPFKYFINSNLLILNSYLLILLKLPPVEAGVALGVTKTEVEVVHVRDI